MGKSYTMNVSDNLNISLSIKNPRIITVYPADLIYEKKDEKNNIIEINYEDKVRFKENNVVSFEKQKYKVQYITKKSSNNKDYYQLHTQSSITKSSNFLMPFLGFDKDYFKWDNGFVNSFVGIEEFGDYGNSIYLLYRFESSTKYTEFENQMVKHPNFIKIMDPDPYHTMYCFNIPEVYKLDSEYILEGKYSKISEDAKKRLMNFHKSSKERPLYQIIYKDPKRRLSMEAELSTDTHKVCIPEDNELYSPFNKYEEIYLNKYKI